MNTGVRRVESSDQTSMATGELPFGYPPFRNRRNRVTMNDTAQRFPETAHIAGVGLTPFGKNLGMSALELQGVASFAALDDAGITAETSIPLLPDMPPQSNT